MVGAVLLLSVVVVGFRKGPFSSSLAPPEALGPLQSAGQSINYNFDSDGVGAMPAKFHGARTGQGTEGKWVAMPDPTAPSKPNVAAQTSAESTDYGFPLKDLALSVKFKAVSGNVDRAGGLVFRLKGANNYYVVRTNALEDNYRLYYVVHRRRGQFEGANFKVASGEWRELKIERVENKIICYYGGQNKIDAIGETFKDAGKVGAWTKRIQ